MRNENYETTLSLTISRMRFIPVANVPLVHFQGWIFSSLTSLSLSELLHSFDMDVPLYGTYYQ